MYGVNLTNGFNVPLLVSAVGGSGPCQTSTCPVDLNAAFPAELQERGPDNSVVGCQSACSVFNQSQFCCTGAYGTAQTCPPTNYSMFFEKHCPLAYSYVYDDKNSTFTCSGNADYVITFCP